MLHALFYLLCGNKGPDTLLPSLQQPDSLVLNSALLMRRQSLVWKAGCNHCRQRLNHLEFIRWLLTPVFSERNYSPRNQPILQTKPSRITMNAEQNKWSFGKDIMA